MKWHVLDRAERAHDMLRRSGGLPDRARQQKRRKPEERLKFKDPWWRFWRMSGVVNAIGKRCTRSD